MADREGCSKVEEDMADRYRNNTEELDEWFYTCYYMDPQPQYDHTLWFTPDDDDIFNVGEIPKVPKKQNPNTTAATATSSRTSIKKLPLEKEKELKQLTEFINITMGLAPAYKSQALVNLPTKKKTEKVVVRKSVMPLPVNKVDLLVQPWKMDEKKEDDHGLNNKRKMMSHCDFTGFEATKKRFQDSCDDRIKEAKKQKTMEVQKHMKLMSEVKPKRKPSFLQKLKTMAAHNKKHHNFQPLVY